MSTTLKNRQITFNGPEGTLINGRISPSVASNNLTVALKTLAGNDPSASDPVYVMIGGTMRSITSALSVSASDQPTNYFDAGKAELTGKEIDYFVYLIWDTSESAVVLGFSRIPYGNIGSDFYLDNVRGEKSILSSVTVATDDTMVNIGRFAATSTLSGSDYIWTVPTYTTSNLIQRPIYETRWLQYTPTLNFGASAAVNTTVNVARYKISGNKFNCNAKYSFTGDPGSGQAVAVLPLGTGTSIADYNYIGTLRVYDQDQAKMYFGGCEGGTAGSTTLNFYPHSTVIMSDTTPITLTTNDGFIYECFYEI